MNQKIIAGNMIKGLIIKKNETEEECYSVNRFLEAAASCGISIETCTPDDFELKILRKNNNTVFLKGKPISEIDFIMPRLGTSISRYTLNVLEQLEKHENIFIANSTQAIENTRNKFNTIKVLINKRNKIPVPQTIVIDIKRPLLQEESLKKDIGYPLVLKIDSGSKGAGVRKIHNYDELLRTLRWLQRMNQNKITNSINEAMVDDFILFVLQNNNPDSFEKKFRDDIKKFLRCGLHAEEILLQEFVKHSAGKDVRILVVGNKVIATMLRVADPEAVKNGEFRSNFGNGGSVEKFILTPEIEMLALRCAQVLGLDIAGIDLLFANEACTKYKVCEVNNSPGFKALEMVNGKKAAEAIMNYIQFRTKKEEEEASEKNPGAAY